MCEWPKKYDKIFETTGELGLIPGTRRWRALKSELLSVQTVEDAVYSGTGDQHVSERHYD